MAKKSLHFFEKWISLFGRSWSLDHVRKKTASDTSYTARCTPQQYICFCLHPSLARLRRKQPEHLSPLTPKTLQSRLIFSRSHFAISLVPTWKSSRSLDMTSLAYLRRIWAVFWSQASSKLHLMLPQVSRCAASVSHRRESPAVNTQDFLSLTSYTCWAVGLIVSYRVMCSSFHSTILQTLHLFFSWNFPDEGRAAALLPQVTSFQGALFCTLLFLPCLSLLLVLSALWGLGTCSCSITAWHPISFLLTPPAAAQPAEPCWQVLCLPTLWSIRQKHHRWVPHAVHPSEEH